MYVTLELYNSQVHVKCSDEVSIYASGLIITVMKYLYTVHVLINQLIVCYCYLSYAMMQCIVINYGQFVSYLLSFHFLCEFYYSIDFKSSYQPHPL